MKKSDITFSGETDETLNVNSNILDEGEDMQTQVSLKNSEDQKMDDHVSKSMAERRGVNSDRRVNNGHDYLGPARRMNIDRRN